MGEITARHIFSVVARYLNLREEAIFSLEMAQNVKSFEEREFDPLDSPLSILNLPSSTLYALNSIGLFLMRDLLGWQTKATDGLHADAISRAEIRWIYTEFSRYLNQNGESPVSEVNTRASTQPIKIDLSLILAAILKDERAIQIVKLRALELRTLEEIANEMGGVSRERIRQIIDHVHQRIRENLGLFTICCNYLEEIAENLDYKTEQGQLTVKAIAEHYIPKLQDARISATADELAVFMAVIRLLAIHDKIWINEKLQTSWKKFSFSVCLAAPPIKTFKESEKFSMMKKKKTEN